MKEEKEDSPGKTILWGVVFLMLALFLYALLSMAEAGESVRLPRIVIWLYKLGGKYLVSSILGLIGVFSIYDGARRLAKK